MRFSNEGLTFIDVLVGTVLILIVFIGIFGAYRLALKVIQVSKTRVLALSVANGEIENLRNLDYPDVPNSVTSTQVTRENTTFNVTIIPQCIDGPYDGKAATDTCPCDLKKVKVKVSWQGFLAESVVLDTIISPRSKTEECQVPAGVLAVSVFDATGATVDSPQIEVKDINTGASYMGSLVGDVYEFVLPPATSTYAVTTTKPSYSIARTFQVGEVYNGKTIANPSNNCYAQPIITILNAQREERSLCIDKLSKVLVETRQAKADHIYYVRKVGSDTNDGLSPDTAFLTIQKAAEEAGAGDIVFVGAGDYQEKVEIKKSGSLGKFLSFVADVNGSYTGDAGEVKILGKDVGFYIEDKSYVEIYGFKISNTTGTAGIYVKGSSSKNIRIINNEIFNNTGDGIKIDDASSVVVSHNVIYSSLNGIVFSNVGSSSLIKNSVYENNEDGIEVINSNAVTIRFNQVFSNNGSGIIVSNNSNNCEISENRSYLNTFDGIQVYDHSASVVVLNNISYSNSGNGIVFKKHISNTSKITSNLVYFNQGSGIVLSDNCTNNSILNNTSFRNQENGILIENSSNNIIKDNIIASSTLVGIKVATSTNIDASYNDVWQNSPNYDGISSGTGSLCVDPQFVYPLGPDGILGGMHGEDDDFHLSQVLSGQSTTSQCVDAGSDLSKNLNMDDKTTRTDKTIDTGQVDMGFHYSLESLPDLPLPPDPFGSFIPDVQFNLRGEKVVGKDGGDNPIYKYSTTTQTDSNGRLTLSNVEWDNYHFSNFSVFSGNLNLVVSYPSLMPIYISPGSTTTVKLGLGVDNSLTVTVVDASSTDPVAFASVRLHKTGYDQTRFTDEKGKVCFIPLEIGIYNIEVQATGYTTTTDSVSVSGDTEKSISLPRL